MPIRIPNELPAVKTLTEENIFVMTETRARTQDIRPLQILLLNLMPTKIATETQLSRLLSNTPLQVELELICPAGHVPKNTPQEHMLAFYKHFDDVKGPELRRHGHHRRAGGAPALRGGGVLAGAVPDHGVDQVPTSTAPSTSAGGPRRGSTTTTASRSTP